MRRPILRHVEHLRVGERDDDDVLPSRAPTSRSVAAAPATSTAGVVLAARASPIAPASPIASVAASVVPPAPAPARARAPPARVRVAATAHAATTTHASALRARRARDAPSRAPARIAPRARVSRVGVVARRARASSRRARRARRARRPRGPPRVARRETRARDAARRARATIGFKRVAAVATHRDDDATRGARERRRRDEATKERDPDDDALLRDAEDARDDDDDGATTGGARATGDDGAEEYADDVDYDEEEVYARTTNGEGEGLIDVRAADRANWVRRPLARAVDATRDALLFQQLDIDYAVEKPHEGLGARRAKGDAAVVRMFGVTKEGHSVCAHVHGFEPYFYASVPENFGEADCAAFRRRLNEEVSAARKNAPGVHVVDVSLERKQSLMHYSDVKDRLFAKITMGLPNMVSAARGILEKGFSVPGVRDGAFTTYPTFESNIVYALRFMVDCAVVGGNWIEFPVNSYTVRAKKASHCQIEVDIMYDKLISHPAEGEYSKLAPFRILSVDIECAGRKGHFPDAQLDPVIQIATLVTEQGSDKPIIRAVWTLDTCAPIVGADVLSFKDERELLRNWGNFLRGCDPDLLIGYNIVNFDFPYLLERAEKLGVADFPYWGRLIGTKVRMRDTVFSSKAYGTHESKEISCEGRVQFDMLRAIQRDYKLSSYSLNAVSAHFLGEQKEDVHYSAISELQNGTPETRRRLAVYCLKDAYLPQRLLDKLMYMYNYIEMARVTGVPLNYLLTRGQSIKVMSQLLRKARQRNMLIPHHVKQGGGNVQAEGGVAYEGATVLDAKAGYYEMPIATLDFASLYPSIMMAHNLCYSTLVPKDKVGKLNPDDYGTSPSGDTFVKASKVKGILPEILEELLGARKRAKADLKKATDPLQKAVLDGRQLALKVSANSVYGFTGAMVGQLPCLEISSSTTAYGRTMIDHTKKMVEEKYRTVNGYTGNAEVIYGDTDSVMIKFNTPDLAESMKLGEEAAVYVSETFLKPIKLEFEKVYWPYLLISKKRYAGLLWTNTENYDKMDTKGIETVRRDNCLLVRQVIETVLEKILKQRDVQGAVKYVQSTIADLLMNRLDFSQLVITKGFTKEADSYGVKMAHIELAQRMRQRDPATAPVVGDRIAYVIIKAAKNAKAYEKSEDPIFALDNNLPIDTKHYLDHYLTKPLLRIFEPILHNAQSVLLHGEHTRRIAQPTPTAKAGGIMQFAKIRLSCIGCRAPISDEKMSKSLCKNCLNDESQHLRKALASVNNLEGDFNRLWTQCQRCQGSLHQDVLCTSRDCPIFYRRKKVQKDLTEATAQLRRFDW